MATLARGYPTEPGLRVAMPFLPEKEDMATRKDPCRASALRLRGHGTRNLARHMATRSVKFLCDSPLRAWQWH